MNLAFHRPVFQWPRQALLIAQAAAICVGYSAQCSAQTRRSADFQRKHPFQASLDAETAKERQKLLASRNDAMSTGATRRFDAQNIEIRMPEAPWSSVESPNHNPNDLLLATRTAPPLMALLLVAEPVGVELKLTTADMVKIVKKRLEAESPGVTFTTELDDTRNGIKGITFEATYSSGGLSRYSWLWLAVRNGYAYQLRLMGDPTYMLEISQAGREFVSHVRQIEPGRVAHIGTANLVAHYDSKELGYELDLKGQGWVRVDPSSVKIAAADFAALDPHSGGFIVLAVPMPKRAPQMDLLTSSVLMGVGLDQPGNEIVRTTPYSYGKLDCKEIEVARTAPSGAKVFGRLRLITDDRTAYVLYGWSSADDPRGAARVEKALNSFAVIQHRPLQVAKLCERQRFGSAAVLNDLGLRHYVRGDLVAAQDFFELAMEFAPSSEAFATNYLEVVSKLGRNDEALAFLETKKATYSKSFVMRALKAKLLCQKGDTAAGRKEFAKLFADGCTDESALTAYVEVANAAKSYDESLTAIDAVLKRKPTVAMQRLQAGLYAIKGDHQKALKLYEDLRTKYPNDVGIELDLASTHGRAKDYDAALKITQHLIDTDKKDEAVLLLHGTFQLQLQQTAEAKKTFEQAKERFPNSERVAEMLKIASSQLGEGDNSCLKKPIAAVDVPPAVRDAIQQANQGEHPDATEFGAEELVRIVGLSFEPGKPMRKTVTHRIKVYNAGGVTRYATLTYRLDSVFEQLYVNKLRVLDGAGNLVSEGAVENYYVADDTSTTDASNRKAVKIPVPGLKPGYTIECTLTREFAVPAKDMPFEQIVMAGDSPIQVSAFFVQGDVSHVKWKAANVSNVKHGDRLLYAVQKNIQPLREEPHQPALETFAPLVWLGPTSTSWDTEAHEYLKMIDDRLHVDDATKKLAAQLTSDCTTKRDKLLAIAAHVQQGYTYRAIEFGRRARVPNAAARTIDLKYGDCKDHALLTRQLLKASGIEASLALVNTSATVVEELPSLEQFNHVVVFVPSTEIDASPNSLGGVCIDTTEKDADPLLEPPVGLANRTIMVLDPHHPHFIHTPDFPENAAKVECQRKLALEIRQSGAVDSHVTEDVTITGYLAPVMRAYFKHFDGESREEAMQSLLSQNGPIRVKRVEVSNLELTREPLHIKVEYTVPNSFYRTSDSSGEKSLVGSLPCGWESRFVLTPATDSRRTPFEVRMARDIASTVDVDLPDGYQIAGFNNYNADGHSKFGSWSSHASQDASKAHVRYSVHLLAGRHPAAAYEEFYSDMNDSLAVLRTPMTLRSRLNATGTAHRPAEVPIAR